MRKWQKETSFGPNFGPFGPQNFFRGFYLKQMLDIVASYHCIQFQRKLMNQTWENSQKHGFGPDFGPNLGGQIFFSKIWLCQSLDIMICYTSWSSCTIPEKSNDPILRKLSDRWTDGRQWFCRTPPNKRRASNILISMKLNI